MTKRIPAAVPSEAPKRPELQYEREIMQQKAEEDGKFTCKKCTRKINNIAEYKLHFFDNHLGLSPTVYRCGICGEELLFYDQLVDCEYHHLSDDRDVEMLVPYCEKNSYGYYCCLFSKCSFRFVSHSGLRAHLYDIHLHRDMPQYMCHECCLEFLSEKDHDRHYQHFHS